MITIALINLVWTGLLLVLTSRNHKEIRAMTETVTQELDDAVTVITTAVSDASAAIKDLANKLATASSLNPGDVQTAAAKLTAIAAGLEAVVAAANEPVSQPEPPPLDSVEPGAEPNSSVPE